MLYGLEMPLVIYFQLLLSLHLRGTSSLVMHSSPRGTPWTPQDRAHALHWSMLAGLTAMSAVCIELQVGKT